MTRSEAPTAASAIAFPAVQPPGYEWLDDEPIFDPAAHLEIRPPAAVTTLAELGYSEDEICPTADAAALAATGERPPPERVLAPEFGGPGWAIALHGNMVVHRGAPLDAPAERITMVNGYVALDRSRDDQSRSRDLIGVDDPAVLATEWARHVAWRGVGRLQGLVDDLPFGLGAAEAADRLEEAVCDVERAIRDMRTEPPPIEHYET